jgi:small subunit ribosomal protein S20
MLRNSAICIKIIILIIDKLYIVWYYLRSISTVKINSKGDKDMPITKSAIKRMRSNEKKHDQNVLVVSKIKTLFKRFQVAVTEKNVEKAQQEALLVAKEFDKAASKGVIPKNRADRKKGRVTKALNKLLAAQSN